MELWNYILSICVWSLFFQYEFIKSSFSNYYFEKLVFRLFLFYLFAVMNFEFKVTCIDRHESRGRVPRGYGPLRFFDTVQVVPSSDQFKRNSLKNQCKDKKKRCTSSILLKFFDATIRLVVMLSKGFRDKRVWN